jgi:hypothetical protein
LAKNVQLHLVLPYSMEIYCQEVPSLHFAFIVRANGDQIHIENVDPFGSPSTPLYVKMTGIQGVFDFAFELDNNIWLRGEAGMLRIRTIGVGSQESNLFSTGIDNSEYSTVTLVFGLGRSVLWQD